MNDILTEAASHDATLERLPGRLQHPTLDAAMYYRAVATDPYFQALLTLRHQVRAMSDWYFSRAIQAKNIDLFLMTNSVSSPSGPGSDSVPIPLSFGGVSTYLVDSSQFGFEPILIGGTDHTYCYLPSMRGEDPDARHLNQFFHCEYEGKVGMDAAMDTAEGYVRALGSLFLAMPNLLDRVAVDPAETRRALNALIEEKPFLRITFDDAVELLKDEGEETLRVSGGSLDITAQGEKVLLRKLHSTRPVWVTSYQRDRVPFYQKPHPQNPDRVLNADLIFPAIGVSGFGGEIVGLGQRQDDPDELLESIRRQDIDPTPYAWYIDLRRLPGYAPSSGFGLGIERFISWALGFDAIYKAILYPRMKGMQMNP